MVIYWCNVHDKHQCNGHSFKCSPSALMSSDFAGTEHTHTCMTSKLLLKLLNILYFGDWLENLTPSHKYPLHINILSPQNKKTERNLCCQYLITNTSLRNNKWTAPQIREISLHKCCSSTARPMSTSAMQRRLCESVWIIVKLLQRSHYWRPTWNRAELLGPRNTKTGH